MTDRPILFSAPMVRALLAGTKTQTRRTFALPTGVDPDHFSVGCGGHIQHRGIEIVHWPADEAEIAWVKPRWAVGDRLWVRETWMPRALNNPISRIMRPHYRANPESDRPEWRGLWKPSIFMPRWASRLTLTVTDVRVQRLQDISEGDASAEGVYYQAPTAQDIAENRALHIEEYGTDPTDEMRGVWIAPGTRNGFSKKGEDEKWGPTAVVAYRWLREHINGPSSWDANPWVVALTFDVRKGNIDG